MKFSFDNDNQPRLTISAYTKSWIRVGNEQVTRPCVVFADTVDTVILPPSIEQLATAHFERLMQFAPEVILLGTGSRQRFLTPALTQCLLTNGVGMEAMDTGAACRSFNVLVAEGRAVLAALFID